MAAFEVYALLSLSKDSESEVRRVLLGKCGVLSSEIQRGLHLTVYHGRRPLAGIVSKTEPVDVTADVAEVRFMVLAPGGENPRPDLSPQRNAVGVRLTKRNCAIGYIQSLREDFIASERRLMFRERRHTTAWKSAFGSRHFQPHIKLLKSGKGIDADLTKIGEILRSNLRTIHFDRFIVRCGTRK